MHDSYIIFEINSIFCLNPDQEWALDSRFTLDLGVNNLVRVSKYSLEGFGLLMFVWKHGIWFACVFLALYTQNIQSCFHNWHIQNLLVFCWLEILLTGQKQLKYLFIKLYWFSIQVRNLLWRYINQKGLSALYLFVFAKLFETGKCQLSASWILVNDVSPATYLFPSEKCYCASGNQLLLLTSHGGYAHLLEWHLYSRWCWIHTYNFAINVKTKSELVQRRSV